MFASALSPCVPFNKVHILFLDDIMNQREGGAAEENRTGQSGGLWTMKPCYATDPFPQLQLPPLLILYSLQNTGVDELGGAGGSALSDDARPGWSVADQ